MNSNKTNVINRYVQSLVTIIVTAACAFLPAGLPTAQAVTPTRPDAVTPDGGRYYGPLVDGKRQGKGKIEWDNGARYEGGFDNGLFSGTGKYQSNSGYVYEGKFENGQYSGQGEIKYSDGRKYKGAFANGVYQGKGRYDTADGQFYEGDFDQGIFTGNGVNQTKDGSRFAGTFKKWRLNGIGTYIDAHRNVYEGTFTDGDLSGKGSKSGKDGSHYEGEFKNWQFHGKGVYQYANGDEYKGHFSYGSFDGEGTLTYATPQKDGRKKDSGTWRYGSLEDKAADKQTKVNVEAAIYNQRSLLDKSLAALAPHEPGKINLYLLAIGGDGAQEVFRRETEFVQNQFDRDFGTKSRSMILVNSRNTVSRIPMATLTSIRESITTIASRMDKQNDILFLFLTSHGSRNHEFTLDQNGMDLRNLEAKELGKLLKESGIRWKAVVVSACYSGGFIDPLKDDYTMVITAARHDRTSFGCADENDFTYFGKAFFKESLPNSKSFDDAFHKAQVLVTKWETEDAKNGGKTGDDSHSEPQIHYPKKIDQYLQQWWKSRVKVASQAGDTKLLVQAGTVKK